MDFPVMIPTFARDNLSKKSQKAYRGFLVQTTDDVAMHKVNALLFSLGTIRFLTSFHVSTQMLVHTTAILLRPATNAVCCSKNRQFSN